MKWVDWLLPRICRLCDAPVNGDIDLCPPCWRSLPWNHRPCSRCGLPLGGADALCSRCTDKPPPFERTVAPLLFSGPTPKLVYAVKFGKGFAEAKLLGRLLGDAVAAAERRLPDALVPVPLTAGRLLRRGHNQAVLLGRPLARRFGVPLRRLDVRRIGAGTSQRGQTRAARAASVRGAFRAVRPFAGTVAIVDDVMTTGATASELARTLLDAGADQVIVWAAARVS